MSALDGNFLTRLLERDAEFKRVYEAHRNCEKRAAKLGKKIYLTREEEIEEKRLKKMKLEQKDKMERIAARYKESQRVKVSEGQSKNFDSLTL